MVNKEKRKAGSDIMADKDKGINIESVIQLLDLANASSEKESNSDKSRPVRTGSAANKSVKETFHKFKDFVTSLTKAKEEKEETTDEQTLPTVINSIVRVMSDIMVKVTNHGASIKKLFDNEKSARESLLDELEKKFNELEEKSKQEIDLLEASMKENNEKIYEELEKKFELKSKQEKDELETCMKVNNDKLEKDWKKKQTDLELECDEARQREMKGTLIVSSPERGHIKSQAFIRIVHWPENNTFGPESEMDMVLRMVFDKYGVRIPWTDVAACHRIGRKENHSYVLKIWNRTPFSPWEMLTKAMLAGKELNTKNIFINFMLTKKRTELSKMVRQAKKDQAIQKYSVDQNGKIFVVKVGNDTAWTEVKTVGALEELKAKT